MIKESVFISNFLTHRFFIISFACLFLFLSPDVAQADRLDELIKRGTLIWGADEEGGGPYAFTDINDGVMRGLKSS